MTVRFQKMTTIFRYMTQAQKTLGKMTQDPQKVLNKSVEILQKPSQKLSKNPLKIRKYVKTHYHIDMDFSK
jgi:hypothetical protein